MNTLKAGFSRVNVTPMMGIKVRGYFKPRFAEGVLDELEINALALGCGEQKVLLLSIDNCGIYPEMNEYFRTHISEVTGLPMEAILIHATHTHTGPSLRGSVLGVDDEDPLITQYKDFVYSPNQHFRRDKGEEFY